MCNLKKDLTFKQTFLFSFNQLPRFFIPIWKSIEINWILSVLWYFFNSCVRLYLLTNLIILPLFCVPACPLTGISGTIPGFENFEQFLDSKILNNSWIPKSGTFPGFQNFEQFLDSKILNNSWIPKSGTFPGFQFVSGEPS